MDMKKLLSAAHAAGYALALPEDFDDRSGRPEAHREICEGIDEPAAAPSRALSVKDAVPARTTALRDWIGAIWGGRAAA